MHTYKHPAVEGAKGAMLALVAAAALGACNETYDAVWANDTTKFGTWTGPNDQGFITSDKINDKLIYVFTGLETGENYTLYVTYLSQQTVRVGSIVEGTQKIFVVYENDDRPVCNSSQIFEVDNCSTFGALGFYASSENGTLEVQIYQSTDKPITIGEIVVKRLCPCPESQFRGSDGQCRDCFQCFDGGVLQNCTLFEDTKCTCVEGAFWNTDTNDCDVCRSCGELPVKTACTADRDTQCNYDDMRIRSKDYESAVPVVTWEWFSVRNGCDPATQETPHCIIGPRISSCYENPSENSTNCSSDTLPEWPVKDCDGGRKKFMYDYTVQTETIEYTGCIQNIDDVCTKSTQTHGCCRIVDRGVQCSNQTQAKCDDTFCHPRQVCRKATDCEEGEQNLIDTEALCNTYSASKWEGALQGWTEISDIFVTSPKEGSAGIQYNVVQSVIGEKKELWIQSQNTVPINISLQIRQTSNDGETRVFAEYEKTIQPATLFSTQLPNSCTAKEKFDRTDRKCVDQFQLLETFFVEQPRIEFRISADQTDGKLTLGWIALRHSADQCRVICSQLYYFNKDFEVGDDPTQRCLPCTLCNFGKYESAECGKTVNSECTAVDNFLTEIYTRSEDGDLSSAVITASASTPPPLCFAATPETPCCKEIQGNFVPELETYGVEVERVDLSTRNIYQALTLNLCTAGDDSCDGTRCIDVKTDQFCPAEGSVAYTVDQGLVKRRANCAGQGSGCDLATEEFSCCSDTLCIRETPCPEGFTACTIDGPLSDGEIAAIAVGSVVAVAVLVVAGTQGAVAAAYVLYYAPLVVVLIMLLDPAFHTGAADPNRFRVDAAGTAVVTVGGLHLFFGAVSGKSLTERYERFGNIIADVLITSSLGLGIAALATSTNAENDSCAQPADGLSYCNGTFEMSLAAIITSVVGNAFCLYGWLATENGETKTGGSGKTVI